jgi:hypothetical protein
LETKKKKKKKNAQKINHKTTRFSANSQPNRLKPPPKDAQSQRESTNTRSHVPQKIPRPARHHKQFVDPKSELTKNSARCTKIHQNTRFSANIYPNLLKPPPKDAQFPCEPTDTQSHLPQKVPRPARHFMYSLTQSPK